MIWQDRICLDPKVLAGKPVIKGTRIAVEFIVDLLGRGWTTEQVLHEYDHLTAEDMELMSQPRGERTAFSFWRDQTPRTGGAVHLTWNAARKSWVSIM
jgi:uncharacterized protein (DUF433 family)